MQVKNQEHKENYSIYNADSCELLASLDSESTDFHIFSPPFASLYTYSNSDRDLGNCKTYDQFWDHYKYIIAEQHRILKSGRLVAIHCMNLPTSKQRDGFIGIQDFRGDIIRAYQDAGFVYHSEVCIWKDPVIAMQRTKALGLLHKTIRKDSSMSRNGIPDYLVVMRKKGENKDPIRHYRDDKEVRDACEKEGLSYDKEKLKIFPVDMWQKYASPIWMDINASKTLQHKSARDDKDERHICPLQLQVIERAIDLWSNPDDVVLSPFMGIGSEGYVAIEKGRKFIGCELKESYYKQAKLNLESCKYKTSSLFD